MRDQYAGDLSDLLKFALLRAISTQGNVMGVGWYYNPEHDGRHQDGRHREYCDEPAWEAFDPKLIEALKSFSERSVAGLEKLPIWPPNAIFHQEPLPTHNRSEWAAGMRLALQEADLVFIDPDNGVGSVSKRHATLDEIKDMSQFGRPLVFIKFPRRQNYEVQVDKHHDVLLKETKAASVFTIRTRVCVQVINRNQRLQRIPRMRWFTVLNADDVLTAKAQQFTQRLNGIKNCGADLVLTRLNAKPDSELST